MFSLCSHEGNTSSPAPSSPITIDRTYIGEAAAAHVPVVALAARGVRPVAARVRAAQLAVVPALAPHLAQREDQHRHQAAEEYSLHFALRCLCRKSIDQ